MGPPAASNVRNGSKADSPLTTLRSRLAAGPLTTQSGRLAISRIAPLRQSITIPPRCLMEEARGDAPSTLPPSAPGWPSADPRRVAVVCVRHALTAH